MRMLLVAQPNVDKGSEAVVSGDMAKTIQATIELIKPEATYFAPVRGQRTMIAVFDLDDPGPASEDHRAAVQDGCSGRDRARDEPGRSPARTRRDRRLT